ncbi:gamma-glutamyl-gamma-aminobutyrate hydrolase family protein [Pseudomonas capsici]|uniref:gamma-glutamyl-gamma-aminobutyrate hydrolase family protein n=1 Tax=Pseudomonas capsici TaxID=2810614 RepID=UPI0013C3177A|nr:gamma-glutamyl-gamma-aminobutyrate hydrolase family protein [Pseudomonas capsici]MCV4286392.1 gamma-glutamyl-gamma-aminobutyrate hydrolase family protein [Pseudomonas capsici]GFM62046.1 hypothetical protein PSCICG_32060 [Pseudomonas cichorii]
MPYSEQDWKKFNDGVNDRAKKELEEIAKLQTASKLLAQIKSSATFLPEVINVGVTFRTDSRGTAHAEHDMKAMRALNEMINNQGKRLFPFEVNPIALPRGASGESAPTRDAKWYDLDDIHLLYIPGAPSANDTQTGSSLDARLNADEAKLNKAKGARNIEEHTNRARYELKLLGIAKQRGIPVLAVCAGSWRLLESYGGKVRTLELTERNKHKASNTADTWTLEHNIKLLGGAKLVRFAQSTGLSLSDITGFNSTHWAVASTYTITLTTPENNTSILAHTNILADGTDTPSRLLEVTAQDPDTHTVEAFESLFGAPVMGIQWHPESYLPTMMGAQQGSPESRALSHSIFEFMVFAAQTAKRRRDVITQINAEEQAFKHIRECVQQLAQENIAMAGNCYMAARAALPPELWTGRMRGINAIIDIFDDYYAELRAKKLVAAGNIYIRIKSELQAYGIVI